MPHPTAPLTPASSLDITGAAHPNPKAAILPAQLPPPALAPKPAPAATNKKTKRNAPASQDDPTPTTTTKRKRAPASTTGTRKIARKTAHSLIERRRRSKMNEEYAVLQGLLPGCEDVEMHKLSVLQASIAHIRVLNTRLDDLRAAAASDSQHHPSTETRPTTSPSPARESLSPSASTSSSTSDAHQQPNQLLTSPDAIRGMPESNHSHSLSYSYDNNNKGNNYAPYTPISALPPTSYDNTSGNPSPILLPQSSHSSTTSAVSELDQEASAALLMLGSDRRGSVSYAAPDGTNGGAECRRKTWARGISVKDLLSN